MKPRYIDTTPIPWRGYQRRLALFGLPAAALLGLGAFLQPHQFFVSYLWSYMFCLSLSLGGLAVLAVHHIVGGGWGGVIRRPLEAAMSVLPWLALGILPLGFGLPALYAWAQPALVASDAVLKHQSAYLNTGDVGLRAVLYFAVWIGLAKLLQALSDEQDRTGSPVLVSRFAQVGPPVLILYGLTTYFAAVDWLVALEPRWFSTAFGLLWVSEQFVVGFALAIATTAWLLKRPPLAKEVKAQHFNDLGNLQLATVMVWAYLEYSQFVVIWAGNLRMDNVWYVHRSAGPWPWVAVLAGCLHFVVPFAVLLIRAAKRSPQVSLVLSGVLLAASLVDDFWFVVPSLYPLGHFSWLDVVAPVALTSAWAWFYLGHLASRPLLPLHGEPIKETPAHAI